MTPVQLKLADQEYLAAWRDRRAGESLPEAIVRRLRIAYFGPSPRIPTGRDRPLLSYVEVIDEEKSQ